MIFNPLLSEICIWSPSPSHSIQILSRRCMNRPSSPFFPIQSIKGTVQLCQPGRNARRPRRGLCTWVEPSSSLTSASSQRPRGMLRSVSTKSGKFRPRRHLKCVSKCRKMQFRVDLPAFQGDFPQPCWRQVKENQHRNAGKDAVTATEFPANCASGILETHSSLRYIIRFFLCVSSTS